MPRRRTTPPPLIPSTALVASATRYPGRAARIYQPRQDWQKECYRHYSICGEARFAARFFGHAVSRAVLFAALKNTDGVLENQTTGPEADALAALFNGRDGQEQMLDSIGTHLTIAGECYLVGRNVEGYGEMWEIVSCIEMKVAGNSWQIDYGDGNPAVQLTESDVVIRIWSPNPQQRIEADSPFRSLLPILGEIEWLTRHVFAQITSRLAGSGILMMPQGMSFPPAPEVEGVPRTLSNDADAFMLTLADAMITPISDPSSPAAIVPIVVTAPDDAIDKAKLLTFWSELDANSLQLRSEAIRRFALGMDLPPEQVLGIGSSDGTGGGSSTGVSHWGAWQIEEATIKLHVEPMLGVIVNSLTIGYLRPALPNSLAVVTFDSSALRLRPDRSREAFELYDRGLISAVALLRENGFDVDDAPTGDEFVRWLLVKVASGSATPEQVQVALGKLGVDLGPILTVDTPRESRPVPSLEKHPPPKAPPANAALLAASEALVLRALERAGNRMRQGGTRPPNVPSHETHCHVKSNGSGSRLLDDAWSSAPVVLEGIADPSKVVPALDSYCLTLLTEQSPHDRTRLADWLDLAGLAS